MCDFDKAVSGRNRRRDDLFDAKQVPAYRRTDDVGDRIDCANFMEVYLFDRCAVNFGFSLAEPRENVLRQILLAPGQDESGAQVVRSLSAARLGLTACCFV